MDLYNYLNELTVEHPAVVAAITLAASLTTQAVVRVAWAAATKSSTVEVSQLTANLLELLLSGKSTWKRHEHGFGSGAVQFIVRGGGAFDVLVSQRSVLKQLRGHEVRIVKRHANEAWQRLLKAEHEGEMRSRAAFAEEQRRAVADAVAKRTA